jgi:hypothetical protein
MKSNVYQVMVEVVALATNKMNPQIVNPFNHLWKVINASHPLSHTFPKYLKLTEIAMMHVLGFIEDE